MTTTISVKARLALAALPGDAPVRIYTVQTQADFARLTTTGRLSGGAEYGDREGDGETYWKPAYDWLRERMAEQVPAFSGDYPVWAWVRAPRYRGDSLKGVKGMLRITAAVPRERIVLSCFHLWHHPLNRFSIDDDGEGMEAMWNAPLEEKAKTWHKCLDLSERSGWAAEYLGQPDVVQACVDGIALEEVLEARIL